MLTYWKTMSDDGETVTLRRFDGTHHATVRAARGMNGVVLDVETTGLSHELDAVTEIAALPFEFAAETGEILHVGPMYTGLQDPGRPLAPEIVKLTGLTDDMLRGQRIDWRRVAAMIDAADVVIAHNARFDRGFVRPLVGMVDVGKVWACSATQIDWKGLGFPAAKLELLSAFHGFFVGAHRAGDDVNALLHLLSMGYLSDLVAEALRPSWMVRAFGAPFEVKDLLKARGYQWDAAGRVWWREVSVDAMPEEGSWLAAEIYRGRRADRVTKVEPCERFAPGAVPSC